MIIII